MHDNLLLVHSASRRELTTGTLLMVRVERTRIAMDRNRCSVCNLELECPPESIGHSVLFECRRCGRHLFSSKLSDWLLRDPLSSEQVALASYELHRRSREGPDLPGEMTKDVFNRILTENSLPTPPEQLNLLFLNIGS